MRYQKSLNIPFCPSVFLLSCCIHWLIECESKKVFRLLYWTEWGTNFMICVPVVRLCGYAWKVCGTQLPRFTTFYHSLKRSSLVLLQCLYWLCFLCSNGLMIWCELVFMFTIVLCTKWRWIWNRCVVVADGNESWSELISDSAKRRKFGFTKLNII